MRLFPRLLVILVLNCLVGLSLHVAGKTLQKGQDEKSTLTNEDVLKLVKSGVSAEVIVPKLERSTCLCDVSTTELRRLKSEGVADEVIFAMIKSSAKFEFRPVTIPKSTIIDIEAAYRISSQEIKTGEPLSFRVVNPVRIDGLIVIDSGATATGRVMKASRGGHFGKAGRLAWVIENVTAVDGTNVPLEGSGHIVGDSKGAKVATQMAITGGLLWPIAPVALLHGFKRGENAYLAQGRRYKAIVSLDTTVQAR